MRDVQGRWAWKRAINAVHRRADGGVSSCGGRVHHLTYRLHPPGDRSYERCIGMSWCSVCREVSENVVSVSGDTVLPDPLAALPAAERERLGTNATRIREYLDRLARRGLWPPDQG
nr:hypothetical protein [uncultured Actinoplanes sp.]